MSAEQQLVQATRDRARQEKDTAAADKAGVEGAEQVVAAKAAVADANKAITDASLSVTRATQALSDAQLSATEGMAKSAIAATNLNEKLNSLPPAAREFVLMLRNEASRDELAQRIGGVLSRCDRGLAAARGSLASQKVVGKTSTVLAEGDAERASCREPAFGGTSEKIGGNTTRVGTRWARRRTSSVPRMSWAPLVH